MHKLHDVFIVQILVQELHSFFLSSSDGIHSQRRNSLFAVRCSGE